MWTTHWNQTHEQQTTGLPEGTGNYKNPFPVIEGQALPSGELNAPLVRDFLLERGYAIEHVKRADGCIESVENYAARLAG